MPNIDREYLQAILTRARNTPAQFKIAQSLFFEIEKFDQKFYLLGTNHAIPLSRLSEFCIQKIAECSNLYIEDQAPTEYDKIIYRDQFATMFARGWGDIWPYQVSSKELRLISKYVIPQLDVYGTEYVPQVNITNLSFKILDYLVEAAFKTKLYPLIMELYQGLISPMGMDEELKNLFAEYSGMESSIYHLQLLSQAPEYEYNTEDITDMVERLSFIENINNNQDPKQNIAYLEQHFPEEYAGYLLNLEEDFSLEHADDQCCVELGNDLITEQRNKLFYNQIEKNYNLTEKPLFAVGAGHLFGFNGLLNMLQQNDFNINKYTDTRQRFELYGLHLGLDEELDLDLNFKQEIDFLRIAP
jgi:uncharacterized protein YbaP (TraB family)